MNDIGGCKTDPATLGPLILLANKRSMTIETIVDSHFGPIIVYLAKE
jgi:hypothetical protein